MKVTHPPYGRCSADVSPNMQPGRGGVKKILDPLVDGSPDLLQTLKDRIRTAQVRAALSVNRELVLLYWQIGRDILARQRRKGWGAKVIDQLAADLGRAFPDRRGFSARNLKYMRAFAEAWPGEPIGQPRAAQIPSKG